MLTEVCDYVHNYFESGTVYTDDYEIVDGSINLDSILKDGQRFKLCGSALNDGIYTYFHGGEVYDDDGTKLISMASEKFRGSIIPMNVPVLFTNMVKDIKEWQERNQAIIESPYQSESFGGYSYTKANASGSGGSGLLSWKSVFGSKLNAYRKIG